MAQAPGHRLGQIIGDTLESAIAPPLQDFADAHGLYLDGKGERLARAGKKVAWRDELGNTHDLDHVLERGGTETRIGVPVAFIETAWRRYTKHSRNKAQEIQGAILPLVATWGHVKPFAGVVVAGVWTQGSLDQLRSNGFAILHIHYDTIIEVFRGWGIDVFYEETTEDSVLQAQIDRWERLTPQDRADLGRALREAVDGELKEFIAALSRTVLRRIECVSIMVLHGRTTECRAVGEAIDFIQGYAGSADPGPVVRYEVIIRYDNTDRITADFGSPADARVFLESFK